jgi:DNA-binding IclR family transcriptional regulator
LQILEVGAQLPIHASEAILGEAGVAAPIFDHSGHAVAAVGVVGDTERIAPRGPPKGLVAAVAEAAAGISRELGARSWPGPVAPAPR